MLHPVPWAIPVVPEAEEAREAARRELTDPGYRSQEPTLFERATDAVVDRLMDLFGRTADAAPGGRWSLVVLVALVAVGAVLLRGRIGRLAATTRRQAEVFGGTVRTAAEHSAAADAALAVGNLDGAIRERFRALVRALEERGLLDARPGRTAHEVAVDAGRVLPGCAPALAAASQVFDEVVYGGRDATRAGHDTVAAAHAAARAAKPARQPVAPSGWAAPGSGP